MAILSIVDHGNDEVELRPLAASGSITLFKLQYSVVEPFIWSSEGRMLGQWLTACRLIQLVLRMTAK